MKKPSKKQVMIVVTKRAIYQNLIESLSKWPDSPVWEKAIEQVQEDLEMQIELINEELYFLTKAVKSASHES